HAALARPAGRHAFLRAPGWRQRDPLPALLLVLRPPRGLPHDPARHGDHLGGHPRVLTQADLRLQGDRILDGRDRVLLDARLGAPHVQRGAAELPERLLHAFVDGDRGAHWGEDLQLARDDLARESHLRHRHALGSRLYRRVHDRRSLGHLPRRFPRRLAGDRHVLRRRAHALRALRRLGVRDLRGALLLVAEDLRTYARRTPGEDSLLARVPRFQPHLLPAAHARAARHAAADLHLPRARPLAGLQPDLVDRRG